MVYIENALVLFRPEAALRQYEAIGKVLRVVRHGRAKIRHGLRILAHPIMSHPQEDSQALRIGGIRALALEQRLEDANGRLHFASLEEREAEVELQARHGRIQSRGLAIKGDRLVVMLLPRFKEAQVGIGLRVIWLTFEDFPAMQPRPRYFCLAAPERRPHPVGWKQRRSGRDNWVRRR